MAHRDLIQLAQSLIRQARMFKMEGDEMLAASLLERGKMISSFAFYSAPALVPARKRTRN